MLAKGVQRRHSHCIANVLRLYSFFFLPLILLKCSHSTLAPSRTLAKHVRISPSKINQDLIVANKVPPGEKCYNIPSLQSIQSFGLTATVKEGGVLPLLFSGTCNAGKWLQGKAKCAVSSAWVELALAFPVSKISLQCPKLQ